ncbi:MAG: hypothetical protein ABJN65_05410 [Parasphingorhabdus sp.]
MDGEFLLRGTGISNHKEQTVMQAGIRYFKTTSQLYNEKVLANIVCFKEDNPFSGTLILTNFRLRFVEFLKHHLRLETKGTTHNFGKNSNHEVNSRGRNAG